MTEKILSNNNIHFKNQIGDVYGYLTIIAPAEPYGKKKKRRWMCRCICGKEYVTHQSTLRTGKAKSCGCKWKELALKSRTTHKHSYSLTYRNWAAMKGRCCNPNHKHYSHYGGRGIKICERWLNSFDNFLADMGERPTPQHTLDRIDVNGDYEPQNCRWQTSKQQGRNRRNNVLHEIDGERKTLLEWCEIYDVPFQRAAARIRYGWNIIDALTRPLQIIRNPSHR